MQSFGDSNFGSRASHNFQDLHLRIIPPKSFAKFSQLLRFCVSEANFEGLKDVLLVLEANFEGLKGCPVGFRS